MIKSSQFKTTTLVVNLGNAVTNYRNIKMKSIDLTSVQCDALIAVLRNPGITATELKAHIQLSQSTLAGIIARLESKGLIDKRADERDARKIILTPTEQGQNLEEQLKEIALGAQDALVKGMSAEEQAEFSRLLQIAVDNINSNRRNIDLCMGEDSVE